MPITSTGQFDRFSLLDQNRISKFKWNAAQTAVDKMPCTKYKIESNRFNWWSCWENGTAAAEQFDWINVVVNDVLISGHIRTIWLLHAQMNRIADVKRFQYIELYCTTKQERNAILLVYKSLTLPTLNRITRERDGEYSFMRKFLP